MKSLCLVFSITIMLVLKNNALYSQDYVPYIQGNSGRTFSIIIPWFFSNPGTSYESEYWLGTDTTINNTTYTTKIVSLLGSNPSASLLLREDPATEQSYGYSPYFQQEFNITMPSSLVVGDTVDITPLVFAFRNPLFQNLFTSGVVAHTVLAVVNNTYDNSVGFGTWYIFDNNDPSYSDFNMGEITFRRGWGFRNYNGFETKGYTMVCLVHEGIDLLQGMGMPNCFSDVPMHEIERPVLYPNQVQQSFQIDYYSSVESNLQIVNAQGAIIQQVDYHSGAKVECSFLSPGVYFIRLMVNQHPHYFRVMKE